MLTKGYLMKENRLRNEAGFLSLNFRAKKAL